MDIKVEMVTEHEDGSATLVINMDKETNDWLINYAVIDIIRNGLAEINKLNQEVANVELPPAATK